MAGMNSYRLIHIGAVAAISGAVAQFVAMFFEPDWTGDPADTIRVVADNGIWTVHSLLDLVGLLLMVAALTVVGRTFTEGAGRDWARLGQPFLVLGGALGAAGILARATVKDVADNWAEAAPGAKQSYLAAFDSMTSTTEALFLGAYMAFALYLATLAVAILSGAVYARWIGWGAAVSAALILVGDLGVLIAGPAWLAIFAGFLLFLVLLIALGLTMWRQAEPRTQSTDPRRPAEAVAGPGSRP